MARLSDVMEARVGNWLFRNTTFPTAPTAIFASFHTADPADTGAGEVSTTATGYGRASVTTGTAGTGAGSIFNAPSALAVTTNAAIVFGNPTASWGTVTHVGFWDAATAGNFLFGALLTTSRAIGGTETSPQIAAGDFTLTLAGVSTYFGNAILNWLVRNTAIPAAPTSAFLSLHSADPGLTGANELTTAGAYARATATTGTISTGAGSSFGAPGATDGLVTSTAVISHNGGGATATANYSATATHMGHFDAATAGNFLWGKVLSVAQTVLTGDPVPSYAVGALTFTTA